ncbi:CHAD domain-containing protein [Pseudomonas sp. SL4(2022)]|uniref:CHAD domain-containing protein n=1 Tax=Pseudomonas sp. SL4(2022) TaxID=2994661 RepID=UPI00226E29B5|nr:CHAD domain-containing protein [Pseudomonas sp. SL4(2022)]WAC44549.1 CHAD domain-containing protein [Pseudomonas sp. SL4(2022)]
MQGMIDEIPRHVLRIQMRLFACRERLRVCTDDEALHDLRIALRQLRSLLRPLSSVAVCEALQQRAAELGRLSGPLRDLEVLQAYLQQQGHESAAYSRMPLLQQGYLQLLDSAPLAHLLDALDDWPEQWRQAASNGQLHGLHKLIKERLRKDRKRLAQALLDPAHDRHRLRLLVKRLRYAAEAYPALADMPGRMRLQLKQVQSALGDWHDHWQWLQRAEAEVDLQPCVLAWRDAMQSAEQQASLALQGLTAGFVHASS